MKGKISIRSLVEAQKWLETDIGRFKLCKVENPSLESKDKCL